jgi:sugar phosphate isomerase/epimerase
LTYCTNIHAGETWPEILESIRQHVPHIKSRVSPHRPMGLGLRLSAVAATELCRSDKLDSFRAFLAERELYVFTINAFPYGPFHGTRVKEDVYQPDWLQPERLAFTDCVAEILSSVLPVSQVGSISTVPGTFKPIGRGPSAPEKIAENLARHAATLVRLNRETDREIVLALEPEPCCFLETVEETIAFFTQHVFGAHAASVLSRYSGLDAEAARKALRRHVGVCYDVCHGAVEYETPAEAFAALQQAGIRIGKLQLSSALRVPEVGPDTQSALSAFDDGVYLHQVIQRHNGAIARYVDLGPAFAALRCGEAGGEWRVHCHVPVFLEKAGTFYSTQQTLKQALASVRAQAISPHLEVETYTWDVLPPELREGNRADAIARELVWVLGELT